MYARPTDCLAPGGQPNDAHNSPFHASKAQNTSLITLEPRSHSHWPPPPTRKEVCGTGARHVLHVSILFLSVALRALGSLCNVPSPEASRPLGSEFLERRGLRFGTMRVYPLLGSLQARKGGGRARRAGGGAEG